MDAMEILKEALKAKGFDGLYTDECGCTLDDFMPCNCDSAWHCEPGYKVKCPRTCGEGHDFHISPRKPRARKA